MSLCKLPFFLLAVVVVTRGSVVIVEPTSTTCNEGSGQETSSSLQNSLTNITSNSVLMLKPGCHNVSKYVPIFDKINVTIEGMGESAANVTIDCGQLDVGMTFANVTILTLRKVTISNCGLTGSNLNDTVKNITHKYLKSFESVFIYHPSKVRIGLLIAISYNVTIDNVHVEKVRGFGFIAVNVIDSFIIRSSRFAYNYNEPCLTSREYGFSGGAIIILQEYDNSSSNWTSLLVEETEFMYNSNCVLENQNTANYNYYSTIDKPFLVGGGGGLTVYLANHGYSSTVDIVNCTFQNNSGVGGGGLLVGTFVGINGNLVTIKDCLFEKNGFEYGEPDGTAQTSQLLGQGAAIYKDIQFPVANSISVPVGTSRANITFINSNFTGNIASVAAGLIVLSNYLTIGEHFESDFVSIEKCTFSYNKAFTTSAVYIVEKKLNSLQPGLQIFISDTVFSDNEQISTYFSLSSQTTTRLNTFGTSAIEIIFNGTNKFIRNRSGTPLSLVSSNIKVSGTLIFANNSGDSGGGMSLSSSNIIILPNSTISFKDNEAYLSAGAIYFHSLDPISDYNCFLFFDQYNFYCDEINPCVDPRTLNITVLFENNIAPLANVAFGSTLMSCPWLNFLSNLSNETNPYRILDEFGIFVFTPDLSENDLSTSTVRFTTEITRNQSLMAGQDVIVNIKAYDGFNQTIPDPISTTISDNTVFGDQDSRLGNSSYWFLSQNKFQDVPVSIRSSILIEEDQEIEVGIFSVASTAGTTFNLTITGCYKGFEFPNTTSRYKTCVCIEGLQQYSSVNCSVENATIDVPSDYWLGEIIYDNKSVWSLDKCVFDYCRVGVGYIYNGEFDQQCNNDYHRTGILCGDCQEGYSQKLGTNRCAKCSNVRLLMSIYFIVGGFSIFATIGRVGVTVSYGYINSLLFFSNVLGPFSNSLSINPSYLGLLFPVKILNGDFGFETCFFNGMTATHRAYLQFLFPAYVYLLLLLYTLIGKYCNFYRIKSWTSNASQVFATVILMTYTSLLSSCINNLSFVVLDNDKPYTLRWTVNPNVKLSSPAHIVLVIISITILVFYLIPSTIMLLFPSMTLRTPIGKRLIPIYDAFWAPFREKLQFWIGFRLILRIIPLIFAVYVPHPLNIVLLAIFIVMYTFIHIVVKPYKREVQNVLDHYLSLCLILILIGSLYHFDTIDNSVNTSMSALIQAIFFTLVMMLVYGAFCFVYIHHFYMKYKFFQNFVAYLKLLVKKKRKVKEAAETSALKNEVEESYEDGNLFHHTGSTNRYSVNNMNVLREALLDDSYYKDEENL